MIWQEPSLRDNSAEFRSLTPLAGGQRQAEIMKTDCIMRPSLCAPTTFWLHLAALAGGGGLVRSPGDTGSMVAHLANLVASPPLSSWVAR